MLHRLMEQNNDIKALKNTRAREGRDSYLTHDAQGSNLCNRCTVWTQRTEGDIENPVPHPTPAPEGGRDREVFCSRYDACLDHIIAGAWPGFSCRECSGFEADRRDSESWLANCRACLVLLGAVFSAKAYRRQSPARILGRIEAEEKINPMDPEG